MSAPGSSTSPSDRLVFVDALRGFALFGVFWANLLIFSGITYMSDEQRASLFGAGDRAAYWFERFFIENKFIGLFSFLFGVSFWLFLSRGRARGGPAVRLFYRRIFWLFVVGAIHGWLLWCFDVLRFYALWAVLLPLFAGMASQRLLAAGLGASIVMPALVSGIRGWLGSPAGSSPELDAMALAAFSEGDFREFLEANWRYDWYLTLSVGQIAYQVAVFGRLLLGLWAARSLDLGNLVAHCALLRRLLIIGALAGVVGNAIATGDLLAGGTGLRPFLRRCLVESGHLGLTLAYASGLALLFQDARWRSRIRALAPIGRMALTWYLFQTVLGMWMFYGFAPGPGLMGRMGPTSLAALALFGFVVQAALARAWLRRFRFGPAEWLWRSLTYGQVPPLRAAA